MIIRALFFSMVLLYSASSICLAHEEKHKKRNVPGKPAVNPADLIPGANKDNNKNSSFSIFSEPYIPIEQYELKKNPSLKIWTETKNTEVNSQPQISYPSTTSLSDKQIIDYNTYELKKFDQKRFRIEKQLGFKAFVPNNDKNPFDFNKNPPLINFDY